MRWSAVLLLALLAVPACRGLRPGPLAPPALAGRGWRVEFTGQTTLETDELARAIADRLADYAREGISKPGVDDAAFELELFYRDHGFPRAGVEYEYAEGADGVRVEFRIEEGPRVVLAEIRLEGQRAFPAADLLAFFPPEEEGVLPGEPRWLVPSRLAAGAGALRDFYRQSGFLAARVSDPAVFYDAAGASAVAVIEIDEGVRSTLAAADVHLHGRLELEGERAERLRALPAAFLQPGGAPPPPYTPRLAQALRAHLLAHYGARGFPDCEIEIVPRHDAESGRVTLDVEIDAGEHVRLAAVEIAGNEKARGGFIRSRLGIEAGDDYDSEAIRAGFGRLYATGLFATVTIALAETKGAERTLLVTVVEAPSIELFVEPGYGSYEGPRLRLGAADKNLFGTGRSLRAESTVGLLAQSATVSFVDRALFRTDVQASGSVFLQHREEPSFTLDERGVGTELTRSWPRRHLSAAVGYRFRRTDLSEVDIVDPIAQGILADVDISSVSTSLTRDTRDHPLVPARGNRARVNVEWASAVFGSEIDFLAVRLEESHFVSLPWDGGILGLSARTGVIEPIGSTAAIPLQQRFFNGGESTVRSFHEDELGPVDSSGEPLGGEGYTVLSAELRQDLTAKFSGAIFLDAGNVAPTVEDYPRFAGFRTAVGAGIRYLLPIGPLRIDAGVNPDPREGEEEVVVHFSVGMAF
ncbi:MAG: BamA/TamA family outer membrane protein [Planctomycetota bacterium]